MTIIIPTWLLITLVCVYAVYTLFKIVRFFVLFKGCMTIINKLDLEDDIKTTENCVHEG